MGFYGTNLLTDVAWEDIFELGFAGGEQVGALPLFLRVLQKSMT